MRNYDLELITQALSKAVKEYNHQIHQNKTYSLIPNAYFCCQFEWRDVGALYREPFVRNHFTFVILREVRLKNLYMNYSYDVLYVRGYMRREILHCSEIEDSTQSMTNNCSSRNYDLELITQALANAVKRYNHQVYQKQT